jgi:hypothetical protein
MARGNLPTDAVFIRHSNAVAAGQTTITPSSGVDMAGFEEVTFLVCWGTIDSTGVQSIEVHQSSDDGASDSYTAITGTNVTAADTDDNKITYVTVRQPTERYVKCIVNRDTADSTVDGIIAVQYGASAKPTTQGSTVSGGEIHVGPAEGSA